MGYLGRWVKNLNLGAHYFLKVAPGRLGHKDITTTMNIYSHVLPSSAREAADKIGQFVISATPSDRG